MARIAVRLINQSQYDLDAQFARSLAMQDEQDAQARRGAGGGQLPYQPRVRGNRPRPQQGDDQFSSDYQGYRDQGFGNQQGQNGQNPPGMLAVENKLNEFAEGEDNRFVRTTSSRQSASRRSTRCSPRPRQSTPSSRRSMRRPTRARTALGRRTGARRVMSLGVMRRPLGRPRREEVGEASRTSADHGERTILRE